MSGPSHITLDAAPPDATRIRMVISYDGTRFLGWQCQREGPTVQQSIEDALARLFTPGPKIHGSSRTDTGVHARGMVVHLDIPNIQLRFPPRKLLLALNAHLPPDVRITRVAQTHPTFHARFDASGKQYRYWIWNHPAHSPQFRHLMWHIPRKLNIPAMRRAAKHFVGKHDFLGFSATPGYERTRTVRTVQKCDVRSSRAHVTVIIEADGFLYKMCRGIVGTLAQVGLGRYSPDDIPAMLADRKRCHAGMTAPANGLSLWEVYYPRAKRGTMHTPPSDT
jgi:tRNA pseudouridine38-40 synthase